MESASGTYAPAGRLHMSFSPDEEDFDDLGNISDNDSLEQHDSATGPNRKGRRGVNSTAEKRDHHNAIERARRGTLNSRFLELAHALPNMVVNKRPSKSAIVNKSLEFVNGARARELTLETENARLRAELNETRAKLGLAPAEVPVNMACSTQQTGRSAVRASALKRHSQELAKPVLVRHDSGVAISPLSTYMSSTESIDHQSAVAAAYHKMYDNYQHQQQQSHVAAATLPDSPIDHPTTEASGSSASDSEGSLVQTPSSSIVSFEQSPLFFEGTAPAISTAEFEHELLAACGMQSSFASLAGGASTWAGMHGPSSGMGIDFGINATFPLYA